MMGMLTHPHAKPGEGGREGLHAHPVRDCAWSRSRRRSSASAPRRGWPTPGMAAAVAGRAGRASPRARWRPRREYAMRQAGADEFWRTYVCSGPRTNIAHGLPTQRRLEAGDLVMIDIHPIVNGYSADICRTVCVGQRPRPSSRPPMTCICRPSRPPSPWRKAGVGMVELERHLHGIIRDGRPRRAPLRPAHPRRRHRVRGGAAAARPRLLPRREGAAAAGGQRGHRRGQLRALHRARGACASRTPVIVGARGPEVLTRPPRRPGVAELDHLPTGARQAEQPAPRRTRQRPRPP